MITIIAGTNRKGSETEQLADTIFSLIDRMNPSIDLKMLKLIDLPIDFVHCDMYSRDGLHPQIRKIQDEFIFPAKKFWFVVPEYNGSYPGIVKVFIDALSVRERDRSFMGKKVCLTGVSSGRAGNLRGIDQLSSIFNYLKLIVMPNLLPVSSISTLKDSDNRIVDIETLKVLQLQAQQFVAF